MKKLFLLFFTVMIVHFSVNAQTITGGTITSGADFFNKSNAKLSSATGELITGLKRNGNAVVTQGFEQAHYTYWIGKISTAWTDTLNWNGPFPGLHTDIIILSPATRNLIVNTTATCRRIYLRPGAVVTISNGNSLLIRRE